MTVVTSPEAQVVVDTTQDVLYSNRVGIRILNEDTILSNPFIAEHIDGSDETSITFEDGHILLVMDQSDLPHFLHLVYSYSTVNILVVLDGMYTYTDKDANGNDAVYNSQLMTLTETSHIKND
jgi:hypothetical protein